MLTGRPFGQRFVNPMSYEEWYGLYAEEVSIADAESGADRELDYDPDNSMEEHYQEYVRNFEKNKPGEQDMDEKKIKAVQDRIAKLKKDRAEYVRLITSVDTSSNELKWALDQLCD